MHWLLRSKVLRWAAVIVEVVVVCLVALRLSKIVMAESAARSPTAPALTLAARFDPADSEYQVELGRLYLYNVSEIDSSLAQEHLERAVRLNPRDPQPWLDLGVLFETQGKIEQAEACFHRADYLAPNIPAYQWAIGNFVLLHGNADEAFRHFRAVLAGSTRYNQVLFSTAWKASGDGNKILTELIPNSAPTEFDYLYYLLQQKHFDEAQPVWQRIIAGHGTFTAAQAGGYLDGLIEAHHPTRAYQAWLDLRAKGIIKPTYEERSSNLVINGDFEDTPLNMGFDWRIPNVDGVYAGLDQTVFHSPSHSLLVDFSGKSNLDFHQLFQYVKVEPGHTYRLQALMRTDGITTDSGPRLEVRDAYNLAALDQLSPGLTGSTLGWTSQAIDFKTGPKTDLITVGLARVPTWKFDNKIAGKVWLDDVSLVESTGGAASAR